MKNTGKLKEYEMLRSELIYSDRVCITLLTFLLTFTATSYSIAIKHEIFGLISLTSLIWTIGYFYISEKRFLIKKIAFYLRTEIEDEELGIFWQNWLKNNKSKLNRIFIRWSPYYLETSYTIGIVTLNPFLLMVFFNKLRMPILTIPNVFYMLFSILCFIVVLISSIRSLSKYKMTKKSKYLLLE